MSADLHPLLERVRAATGGDRELDYLILCALVAPAGAYVSQSPINGEWVIYSGTGRNSRPLVWDYREGVNNWWRPGGWPLTSSLDAALAVVERALPNGYWRVQKLTPGELGMRHPPAHPHYWATAGLAGQQEEAAGSTPALAILAAMLSALQAAETANPQPEVSK